MKLIKLQDKFILVSDEEIKEGDWVLNPNNVPDIFGYDYRACFTIEQINNCKKIIAGIPSLPSIDFSLLSEKDCKTIGWIDVEKLALKKYPKDENWTVNSNNSEKRLLWQEGFKTAQSLNDKMFSFENLIKFSEYCRNTARRVGTYDNGFTNNWELCSEQKIVSTEDLFKSYQSLQKTEWDVEIEMEIKYEKNRDFYGSGIFNSKVNRPKITNNSIKVIKIL